MRYCITADQQAFFDKKKGIEFEKVFTEEELAALKKYRKEARDAFREDTAVQKIVMSPLLVTIAKDLFVEKKLRIGFDQIFDQEYMKKFCSGNTLNQMSSITPLVGGVMICVEGESGLEPNRGEEGVFDPFPQKPGNVLFFGPEVACGANCVEKHADQRFLLVGYAILRAMYVLQENDPHTHALKRLGYVFGDRLKETTHPVVGR